MQADIFISKGLAEFISNYRKDQETVLCEQSMIADAMCGLEITIHGMHVDNRTEKLLRNAMSVISSYHYLLDKITETK
jgi:hypothetical protein